MQELLRHGLRSEAIAIFPVPARIALDGPGERYWLDDAGRLAWVLPVCCADPGDPAVIEAPDPTWAISIGPVIDLLAFHPDAPGRWALRLGNAVVLGAIWKTAWKSDPALGVISTQ